MQTFLNATIVFTIKDSCVGLELYLISSMLGYDPWYHGGTNAAMSMVPTQMCDVYPLATRVPCICQSQKKVLCISI